MALVLDILTGLCLAGGTFFILVGSLGLIRMPDVFTRCHAAGMVDTAGIFLILLGLIFQAGFTLVAVKLLLIGFFTYFTSPVSSHATIRAAIVDGAKPILDKDVDISVEKVDPASPGYRVLDTEETSQGEDVPSRT